MSTDRSLDIVLRLSDEEIEQIAKNIENFFRDFSRAAALMMEEFALFVERLPVETRQYLMAQAADESEIMTGGDDEQRA